MVTLIILTVLMILGAIVALESKDLLSGIISLGIIGFALTINFLILHAPDLAIVQIIIETLTLIILIAAILKTTREETVEKFAAQKVLLWVVGLFFMLVFVYSSIRIFNHLPEFGEQSLRMAKMTTIEPDLTAWIRGIQSCSSKIGQMQCVETADLR
ncbi:MAG: hydrogenase subunit MbhD domain-containing protein [bacterium]